MKYPNTMISGELSMAKDEVLISVDRLKRLEACEVSLYAFQNVKGLCPICEKAMLCCGLTCRNCGYDISNSIKEWKQMHIKPKE